MIEEEVMEAYLKATKEKRISLQNSLDALDSADTTHPVYLAEVASLASKITYESGFIEALRIVLGHEAKIMKKETISISLEEYFANELRIIAKELGFEFEALLVWMLENQHSDCEHKGWPDFEEEE